MDRNSGMKPEGDSKSGSLFSRFAKNKKEKPESSETVAAGDVSPVRIQSSVSQEDDVSVTPLDETSAFLRVLIIQWNMHDTIPGDLNELIPNNGRGMDLIVFGFQESTYSLQRSSAAANDDSDEDENEEILKIPSRDVRTFLADTKKDESYSKRRFSMKDAMEPSYFHLCQSIENVIHENFLQIRHARRAKMQLIIYCRRELKHAVKNVQTMKENTGFLHVFPNKGGLCVSLTVSETTLTFISCHLTALEGYTKCAQRNDSVEEILGGVRFGDKSIDPTLLSHHTFVFGDLNYRITLDPRLPPSGRERRPSFIGASMYSSTSTSDQRAEVLQMVVKEQWEDLLKLDELEREMTAGRVLDGFTALTPKFPPTYKRLVGKGIKKYFSSGADAVDPVKNATTEVHPLTNFRYRVLTTGVRKIRRQKTRNPRFVVNISRAGSVLAKSLQNGPVLKFGTTKTQTTRMNFLKAQGRPANAPLRAVEMVSSNESVSADQASESVMSSEDGAAPIHSEFDDINLTRAMSSNGISGATTLYVPDRMPSYTDRIAYKSQPRFAGSDHIKPMFFESCEAVATSDHKPVRACFEITLPENAFGIMVPKTIGKFAVINRISMASADIMRTKSAGAIQRNEPVPNILRLQMCDVQGTSLTTKESGVFVDASDPFMTIWADPAQIIHRSRKSVSTSSVRLRSPNPHWAGEVFRIDICTVDLHGLSSCAHIYIGVWDNSKAKATSLIGLMVVSMKDIIDAHLSGKSQYEFDGPIYNNALKQGRLKGTIHLAPAYDDGLPTNKSYSLLELSALTAAELNMEHDYNMGTTYQKSAADTTFLMEDEADPLTNNFCCLQ